MLDRRLERHEAFLPAHSTPAVFADILTNKYLCASWLHGHTSRLESVQFPMFTELARHFHGIALALA